MCGRDVDAPHLIEVIQELGGHVDAWLLTHPHSDHVGAITEILNMDPMPISIGKVYYSFLNKEFLGQEQVSRRDSDLECYDRITEAIAKRCLYSGRGRQERADCHPRGRDSAAG